MTVVTKGVSEAEQGQLPDDTLRVPLISQATSYAVVLRHAGSAHLLASL